MCLSPPGVSHLNVVNDHWSATPILKSLCLLLRKSIAVKISPRQPHSQVQLPGAASSRCDGRRHKTTSPTEDPPLASRLWKLQVHPQNKKNKNVALSSSLRMDLHGRVLLLLLSAFYALAGNVTEEESQDKIGKVCLQQNIKNMLNHFTHFRP